MNFMCDPSDKDNIFLLQHCLSPCYLGQQSLLFKKKCFIKAKAT